MTISVICLGNTLVTMFPACRSAALSDDAMEDE